MQIKDCYFLGKIIKQYGKTNQVIIDLDTDEPKFYLNLKSIFVQLHNKLMLLQLSSAKLNSNKKLIISFQDINYNSINTLIGKLVFLPLNTLPKLKGNKFYYHEVIGFSIINQFNKKIGIIILINDQTNQTYFIVENSFKKNIYIPIINSWIIKVNRKIQIITMLLPEEIENL